MIYLDNNATTQVDPEVLEEAMPFLTEQYGNPSALYPLGKAARDAIELARERVAEFINAKPEQIVFTSGGTEANNMVFEGTAEYLKKIGKTHIITDMTEHDSVLNSVERLKTKHGFYVSYLDILPNGKVNIELFEGAIAQNTGLVSIMGTNNETGATNDIDFFGEKCAEYGLLFHTDCVQTAGCDIINVEKIKCDFLTLSAHKLHGIKGTGALYVKNRGWISPLIIGGHDQEKGLRGGTENVAGIVAFGKACQIQKQNYDINVKKIDSLNLEFHATLLRELEGMGLQDIYKCNLLAGRGKTLNIRFDGIDGQTLVLMLAQKGICISAGSACRSNETTPSKTLIAMGLSDKEARNSVRISFSRMNDLWEVELAAKELVRCVCILRVMNLK